MKEIEPQVETEQIDSPLKRSSFIKTIRVAERIAYEGSMWDLKGEEHFGKWATIYSREGKLFIHIAGQDGIKVVLPLQEGVDLADRQICLNIANLAKALHYLPRCADLKVIFPRKDISYCYFLAGRELILPRMVFSLPATTNVFPEGKKDSEKLAFSCSADDLMVALQQTTFAAKEYREQSLLDHRRGIVLFKISDHYLTIWATDSYRLARKNISGKGISKPVNVSILPQHLDVLTHVLKMIDPRKRQDQLDIRINMKGKNCFLTFDECQILVPFDDPSFTPEHLDQLVPQNFSAELRVESSNLAEALRIITPKSKVFRGFEGVFSPEGLQITTDYSDEDFDGSFSAQVGIKSFQGNPGKVTLNPSFILDYLRRTSQNGQTIIKIPSGEKPIPIVFSPTEDDSWQYLVMPRIKSSF